MIPKAIVYLPLFLAVICLPMALRLVPPNGMYGIRTMATLGSTTVWYTANFRAGVTGVVAGLAATVLNVLAVNSATITDTRKLAVLIGTMIGTVLLIIVAGVVRS